MTPKAPGNEAFVAREPDLKNVGLKATLPRMRVLEIIRSSEYRHLSAEDVYRRIQDQGSDVGLATVYRVLSQLEGAGLLTRNVFDGGKAVFEINEGRHHDHLICVTCGRVDEFRNEAIDALEREVAATQGYELADHRLALYGHCGECMLARRGVAPRRTLQGSRDAVRAGSFARAEKCARLLWRRPLSTLYGCRRRVVTRN
jgi:Fur family ferric uptake transcriptional regulator